MANSVVLNIKSEVISLGNPHHTKRPDFLQTKNLVIDFSRSNNKNSMTNSQKIPSKYIDLNKIYIDEIFKPIIDNFMYFVGGIVSLNSSLDYQKILVKTYDGKPERLALTVDYDGFVEIQCSIEEILKSFNAATNLRMDYGRVSSDIKDLLIFQGRQIAISLFNILEFSTYNKKMNQTEIFKFAKEIRNGAAHNNRFYFEKPLTKPIKWRNKTIDNNLKNQNVFLSFITPADLMVLMSDISLALKK